MVIKDGNIVEASEKELFEYWSTRYDDVIPYYDFLRAMKNKGVLITDTDRMFDERGWDIGEDDSKILR